MRLIPVLFVLLLVAPSASGHPGHGTISPDEVHHYLISPIHAIPILSGILAGAGVIAASRIRRRKHALAESTIARSSDVSV